MTDPYSVTPSRVVNAPNGIDYAYREVGDGTVALVLFQHFHGNLDNRDPALIDRLASQRRVVTFDSVGVGATTGQTPHTVEQMATRRPVVSQGNNQLDSGRPPRFLNRKLHSQDLLVPSSRAAIVRRVILASLGAQRRGRDGGRAPEVIDAVGKPQTDPQGYLDVFFTRSSSSPAQRRRGGSQADVRQNRRPRYANHLGNTSRLSTTQCAPGEFRITHSSRGWAPSMCRCSVAEMVIAIP